MIKLTKSYIKENRLIFDAYIDDIFKQIWFEVEPEYTQYLCYERSDAFIIGILYYAMRYNHDIISEVPISQMLLYNIEEHLIPSVTRYDKRMHRIKITAPLASGKIENAGAVGTGMSCGVDSFHCVAKNLHSKYTDLNLTHLCVFNVGSFDGNKKMQESVYEKANIVAKELKLPLITTNSNIENSIKQGFEKSHSYTITFAIYCLQKLFKLYYCSSSGYDYGEFSLKNNMKKASGVYELLSLNCFSNENLRIILEGGAYDRYEKTATIAKEPVAQNHLQVCTTNGDKNCNICFKCMRTILTLDTMGKLDEFSNVFDVDFYRNNKLLYLHYVFNRHLKKDKMIIQVYDILKKEIPLWIKILCYMQKLVPISPRSQSRIYEKLSKKAKS